jgi:hypothetical protein
VTPAQFTQPPTHRSDHVRDPRLQGRTSGHVATPPTPTPVETSEQRNVRVNEEISSLVRRKRQPNSWYPPYLKGNGTYTHVESPQGAMEFLPLGLGGGSKRPPQREPPKLTAPVKDAYGHLKRALHEEEKTDRATFHRASGLQVLTTPDRSQSTYHQQDENGDTEMGGMKAGIPAVDSAVGTPTDWSRKSSVISLPPQLEATRPTLNSEYAPSPDSAVRTQSEWSRRISVPQQPVPARRTLNATGPKTPSASKYNANRDPRITGR